MKQLLLAVLLLATIVLKAQTTITLQPGTAGKDAVVYTINPDANYSNSPACKCMGWTHSGVPGIHRSLLDIDLSEIPQDALILEARLNLYFATFEPTYVPHSGDNMSYLATINERWDEFTVTWNNQPSIDMEHAVVLPPSSYPEEDFTDIDVTEHVQEMRADPDHHCGWMLKLDNENPYNCLMFASSDCEDPLIRPKLIVTYVVCETPTAGFTYTSEGLTFHFQDTSHWAYGFDWDFGDLYYSSAPSPNHTYDSAGYYTVCQRVYNDCSADTLCVGIFAGSSGMDEGSAPMVSVYPNPCRRKVYIDGPLRGKIDLTLIDVHGLIIYEIDKYVTNDIISVDLDRVPAGIYCLRILGDDFVFYKKIIKQ